MAFSIAFSNFRQFKEFPPILIDGITCLVGGNNSGKSTLVKAILTLTDFLQEDRRERFLIEQGEGLTFAPRFYFDIRYLTHIGTFNRAICNKTDSDTITFGYRHRDTVVELEVKGARSKKDLTNVPVVQIRLTDLRYGVESRFDFEKRVVRIVFNNHSLLQNNANSDAVGNLQEYFASVPENAVVDISLDGKFSGSFMKSSIFNYLNKYVESAIGSLDDSLRDNTSLHRRDFFIQGEDVPKLIKVSDETRDFLVNSNRMGRLSRPYYINIRPGEFEYIYAHAVSQQVIYSAKDTNDYVALTIHEFAGKRFSENSKSHKLVTHWMDKFGIGKTYKIQSVGGEAHIVQIISEDEKSVNLADKGMGSIQLMILLFRIAIIISEPRYNKYVIIEEPEQNLHPRLQSELAEFFFTILKDYNIQFIIETHSEYFIRKTQVIVKREKETPSFVGADGNPIVDLNPFRVYYFGGDNADGKPYYPMKYQPDGAFENDFGKGFFDEADNLAFEIL